ncbi:MAG: molybdopterin-dependent oxidoreductase [Elusimicrobia bacterium]|nr:molybdopterin-dependent oxidoreductase [Elusimicrobiota bacterium]
MSRPPLTIIGGRGPKVDALAKATGRARYADDLTLPRMLHGKLLRSPHAHARIVRLDAGPARRLRGVRAVITGADLPERYGILPVSQDETALALDKVRYAGEPVAAVAADTEALAEEACRRVRVAYEPLRPVLSVAEALAPGGEPVHEAGNLHKAVAFEFGEPPAESEAEHAREDLFYYEGNTHLPLEEHAALAVWKGGRLTLHSSTQTPFYLRKILAKVFGLPDASVRVVVPALGGGFGGKLDPFSHELCAARLARAAGRPVKIALAREEVFQCHRGRHPAVMRVRTQWRRSGELLSLGFEAGLDGGAYGSFGVVCTYYHGGLQPTTYRIPHYRAASARYFTNKPPCGPKRGHGTPQPRFALEVHLDKVAEELGVDPVALRLKNLIEPDSVTVNQLRITSCGLRECVERVVAASGFQEKRRRLPYGRGVGFALGSYLCGAAVPIYWSDQPHSTVRLRADRSGVTIFSGATDIGQGSDTVLVSVVAETLGAAPERLRLVAADTGRTPLDLGTYSSRVTYMAGNAAKAAAEDLLARLREAAPGAAAALPFEKLLAAALASRRSVEGWGRYRPPEKLARFKGSGVGPSPAYSFCACVAEVDCDPETGRVLVRKVAFAHDIGRALNRTSVEGQIEGAVHMALGEALLEEQSFLPTGLLRKPSILDYKFLPASEMPEVTVQLVETNDPGGPYGAKEVGQGPLLPVVPAVANAIYDALRVRVDETPFTPERVLAALERKAAGREPRVGPAAFPPIPFPEPRKVARAAC